MHSPGLYDGSGLLPREYGLSVYDIGGQYERLKRRVEVAERSAAALDFSDTPMSRGADPSRLAAAVPNAAQPVAVEETATATSPLVYVAAASVAAVALFILLKK